MRKRCKYGSHRVIEPKGALPQMAWRIDNDMVVYENEILVDVDMLNIDAASFLQIREQAQDKDDRIREIILDTVLKRGKQHNPITGSGGMFTGRVRKVGESLEGKTDLEIGNRIASLVSLSLTPLKLARISKITRSTGQLEVEGQAILFEKTVYAKLPENINSKLATALLDVAGAPAQTYQLVRPADTVLIIGAGGKSGLLCSYVAKKKAGSKGCVIGAAHSKDSVIRLKKLGLCDRVVQLDATNPLETELKISDVTSDRMADVTINCANVSDTEMASILATKDRGVIYFFNMGTSFCKAALGAEGIGKEVKMIIGNGYLKGHDKLTLGILEESALLREFFEEIYGPFRNA